MEQEQTDKLNSNSDAGKESVGMILRCSNCAFVNPEDSLFCGMCGNRLAVVWPKYSKMKKKKVNYSKSVVSGNITDAAGYGGSVWAREMWRFIGLSTLVLLFGVSLAGKTHSLLDQPQSLIPWIIVDILYIAVVFAGSCRLFLDVIRERRVEPFRGITAGIQNIFPAVVVVLLTGLIIAVTSGIVFLWIMPVSWLTSPNSIVSSELVGLFIMIWMTGLLVLLLLPVYIWLIIGSTFTMCSVLDRKKAIWKSPSWTMHQIASYHWDLFRVGLGQAFAQLMGLLICYIGHIGSIPMTGVTFTAVYEYLRLRGRDADNY